jgi:hypothetical protein
MSALCCLQARIRVLEVERDGLVRWRDSMLTDADTVASLQAVLTTDAADLLEVAVAEQECAPADRPWRDAFSQLIQPNREPTK